MSDPDVQIARNYIDRWVMDGHADARHALERIEQRLNVGAALANIVDSAVKAGLVTPAFPKEQT